MLRMCFVFFKKKRYENSKEFEFIEFIITESVSYSGLNRNLQIRLIYR